MARNMVGDHPSPIIADHRGMSSRAAPSPADPIPYSRDVMRPITAHHYGQSSSAGTITLRLWRAMHTTAGCMSHQAPARGTGGPLNLNKGHISTKGGKDQAI